MRVFIAIDLPPFIKDRIGEVIAKLQECNVDAKWVKPTNLHLTLKFLGEVDKEKIEEIKMVMENISNKFYNFKISFKGFGFFPSGNNPRVFFIATTAEETLKQISIQCEEELEKIGFKKENRFKSHITLARLRKRRNIDCLKKRLKDISLKETCLLKEITLFKSTLTKEGPIYEEIFKSNLKQ
jgi:2'-5' RNA ligase